MGQPGRPVQPVLCIAIQGIQASHYWNCPGTGWGAVSQVSHTTFIFTLG
jgi:hypothetical protein